MKFRGCLVDVFENSFLLSGTNRHGRTRLAKEKLLFIVFLFVLCVPEKSYFKITMESCSQCFLLLFY